MRVIVQDTSNNLFYQGGEGWGKDALTAHDFGNSFAAMEFCIQKEIRSGQVVVCSGNSRCEDVRIKVFFRTALKEAKRKRHCDWQL